VAGEIYILNLLQPGVILSPEKLTYDTYAQEQIIGSFVVESRGRERDLWEFYSRYEDHRGTFITSQTTVRKKDLRPVATHKVIDDEKGRFTISALYNKDKVKVTAKSLTMQDYREFAISEITFDNEAVLMLLRAIAWQEGVESFFEGFILDSGQKYFSWLKILQQEEVTCGVGEMETWHIRLSLDSGNTQEVWYGTSYPHVLVMYKNNLFRLILKRYESLST
jgi:hypothetical protein